MTYFKTTSELAIKVNFVNNQIKSPVERNNITKPAEKNKKRFDFLFTQINKVSTVEKIFLTRHFVTMFEAGIPLNESISIAREETDNKYLKAALQDIYLHLENGQSFSSSLGAHPKIFNKLYIKMLEVGETSGRLSEVLNYLLHQQEDEYRLHTRIRNALIYPVTTVVVMIMIVIGVLLFIIPEIAKIYAEEGIILPLFTRALIGISNFVVHNGLYMLVGLIFSILIFLQILKTTRGHKFFDGVVLKLPIFGKIVKYINISRFTRNLSDLIQSGISIDQALTAASGIMNNVLYQQSLAEAVTKVQQGKSLSDCLRSYPNLYPPLVNRMTVVGEKSGKIDSMFKRIAQHYEDLVFNTTNNLSSMIEPVLIILVGGLVGSIAVAVLFPIWNFAKVI